VDQDSISVGGVPGAYALGDVVPGDVVVVTFTNASNPECNDTRDAYIVQSPCEFLEFPEGCARISFDYTNAPDDFPYLEISEGFYDSTDATGTYFTVVGPTGTTVIGDDEGRTFLGDGEAYIGSYCVYRSDSDGNPIVGAFQFLRIGALYAAVGMELSNFDLSGLLFDATGTPDGMTGLFTGRAILPSPLDLSVFSGMNVFRVVTFQGAQPIISTGRNFRIFQYNDSNATTGPSLLSSVDLENFRSQGNSFPTAEVNRLLDEAAATATGNSGIFNTFGQTPAAPPSGAGLTAKSELEGRSPGWTVTTD
jgi:hypothetical protein